MKIKKLAIVVEINGKIHQVALAKHEENDLLNFLPMLQNGSIKVYESEITGIILHRSIDKRE